MVVLTLVTPFAEWLAAELAKRPGATRGKLAAAIDAKPQTVSAWFNEGRLPDPKFCVRIANYLHVNRDQVLYLAGHLDEAPTADAADELPAWLRDLLPVLSQLDPAEGTVIEHSARGLLEMRELRGPSGAERPD